MIAPAPSAVDGGWLAGSEGFRVESPAGPVGRVAEIERDADSGEARAILVRSGILGGHKTVVPVREVVGVVPSRRLVVLQDRPE